MRKQHKLNLLAVSIAAGSSLLLAACGGGSNSATTGGGQNLTGAPISAKSSPSLFSSSSCLSGSVNLTGTAWWVNATVDIKNVCNSDQSLAGTTISFTAQDANGKAIQVGTLNNWWFNGTSYQLAFMAGNGNQQIANITAADVGKLAVPANQTLTFQGGFQLFGSDFKSDIAKATFTINGASPAPTPTPTPSPSPSPTPTPTPAPVTTGSLNVVVDTTDTDCKGTTTCNDLGITVTDTAGNILSFFKVPPGSLGGTYKQQINKLDGGSSYTVSGSTIPSTTVTYTPSATPSITAGNTSNVTITYARPVVTTGKATISLASVVPNYTGNLQVQILNTKASNTVVNSYTIKQGGSFTTEDLPTSDSSHAYVVKMTTGIADPLQGLYYVESGLPVLTITKAQTTSLVVPMKASSVAKKNVTVAISGMSTGDTAAVTFSDAANKYSYVNYTNLANSSPVYKIESGLNLGESVTASSNSYVVNPITNTAIINAATTISAAFMTKPVPVNNRVLSVFWCGFSGDFCGQSTTDDVNPKATHVILAFANTNPDGSVFVDTAHWPTTLIKNWQAQGKKVIISVGGQNGLWVPIFQNPDNFINSIKNIINTYGLDGVDLDIENYETAPQAVALTINQLRAAIGASKQIIVSPEIVGVYQASPVPSATAGGNAWNYFVPVLKDSLNSIDYVQPQFYNNWYGGIGYNPSGASADYIVNGYVNWMNQVVGMFPATWGTTTIPNFSGVPANKLVIGVLASTSAGGAAYYATPDMIAAAFNTLQQTYKVQPAGIMMWDSNWDTLNNKAISNEAVSLLGL